VKLAKAAQAGTAKLGGKPAGKGLVVRQAKTGPGVGAGVCGAILVGPGPHGLLRAATPLPTRSGGLMSAQRVGAMTTSPISVGPGK